jgi:RNA polymerase sigma factor (sigma-70 family)
MHIEEKHLRVWQKGVIPLSELSFQAPKKRVLGIDVGQKYYDIRRLFFKKYAKMVVANGDDPEDVLQEVCKGILQRNRGSCPFDPEKSAFSTYVMLVSHCVVSNWYKKKNSYTSREVELDEGTYRKESDNGSSHSQTENEIFIRQIRDMLKGDFQQVFDLLLEGCKMTHISRRMGISIREVQKKVEHIRKKVAPKVEYMECGFA